MSGYRASARATITLNGAVLAQATNVTVTGAACADVGDPTYSVVSRDMQERILEAARARGVNLDRLHFYEDHIIFDDQDVPDEAYDAAARHDALRPAALTPRDDRWYRGSSILYVDEVRPFPPPCFTPFEDGPRRGKSGKNKATRRFDLPPRRL